MNIVSTLFKILTNSKYLLLLINFNITLAKIFGIYNKNRVPRQSLFKHVLNAIPVGIPLFLVCVETFRQMQDVYFKKHRKRR